MAFALQGKVAFVTGGARGIGAATVQRLASEGAAVVFTYAGARERAEALVAQIRQTGGQAMALQADSGEPLQLREAIHKAAALHGRIDILVNNAGLLVRGDIADYPPDEFDRMFHVNVRGAFVAVQTALPFMQAGARIVLLGSVVAERAGFAGGAVYALTKGALAAFTRGLARDLGPRGIGVVNVQPGPTITDMSGGADPATAAMLAPLMASGRLGQPDEIAAFVAFLGSSQASFITGASLSIDGGYLA